MLDQINVVSNPLAIHIMRGWLLNGGEPWGRTNAVMASGQTLRVEYAFEHPRHGLMLHCRESWFEDGSPCSMFHNIFPANVERIIHV